MLSVVHNLGAMNAQRQFNITGASIKKSMEKLSSGYKINRAADDAAGLTISEKMRSLIRGMNQGSDNIQDGISVCQIMDGALAESHDILHRMTELSVKASNGTLTPEDRQAIQSEINQLIQELDRTAESTQFNTKQLLAPTEFEDTPVNLNGGKADVMIAMKNEVPIYRADEMHRIGCDFLQGYLFSPPVPIEEFKDKCASHVL